MIGYQVVEKF